MAHAIEQTAANWFWRLDAKPTPDNAQALEHWLSQNPRHRAAYTRLTYALQKADRLSRLRPFDGHVDPDLLARRSGLAAALRSVFARN